MAGFYRDRGTRNSVGEGREFPLAVRPAVEIIAKLSADRNRLRDELDRVREELHSAPRVEELEQLRRERDALQREVAELKARPAPVAPVASVEAGLASRVDQLERAVARLERLGTVPVATMGTTTRTTTRMSTTTARAAESAHSNTTPRSNRIPGQRGPLGGMLGGLVKANIALREAGGPDQSATSETPTPQLRGGSSLLGCLVSANKELRSTGSRRRRTA